MTDLFPSVIFDIDGTLSSSKWREWLVLLEKPKWKQFFTGIPFDPVIPEIAALTTSLRKDTKIFLITARPDAYRIPTVDWLTKYGIQYNGLLMRRNDDHRPADVVKAEIFERQLGMLPTEWIHVFEDNFSCIEMWMSLGLSVTACKDPHLTPPLFNQWQEKVKKDLQFVSR